MKVAITGHTRGLGFSISSLYTDVKGFSRGNGYDIELQDDRTRIIAECNDCDVFINNAHSGFGQQFMLYDLWESWKGKEKIIINIGSVAADHARNVSYPYFKYAIQKQALESASMWMAQTRNPCKVICVKPGYINTTRVQNNTNIKMDADELAKQISTLLVPGLTTWIPLVTFYTR